MELIVGVADMKVSRDPDVVLVTHSLGSCIGLAIYDPVVKVGGLLHYMLPDSELDLKKSRDNPAMFGDTGIPLLFKSTYKFGAKKSRLKVVVAGGAQIMDQNGLFNIGNGYIKKPFQPEDIREMLNRIMGEKEDGDGDLDKEYEGGDF